MVEACTVFHNPNFRAVDEYYSVYTRRKPMNAEKSKVMVFEREVEVVDSNTHYKVSVLALGRCEVVSRGEKMKEAKE